MACEHGDRLDSVKNYLHMSAAEDLYRPSAMHARDTLIPKSTHLVTIGQCMLAAQHGVQCTLYSCIACCYWRRPGLYFAGPLSIEPEAKSLKVFGRFHGPHTAVRRGRALRQLIWPAISIGMHKGLSRVIEPGPPNPDGAARLTGISWVSCAAAALHPTFGEGASRFHTAHIESCHGDPLLCSIGTGGASILNPFSPLLIRGTADLQYCRTIF